MKKRMIPAALVLLVFAVASLYLSYNLHWLLQGREGECSADLFAVLRGLGNPRIRNFFLLFLGVSALAVWYMLVAQSYIKYKSDMQQITPDLETPKAEGQGQYGTARWLSHKKLSKAFGSSAIDVNSQTIRELLRHGYDDLNAEDNTTKEEQVYDTDRGI